MNLHEDISRIKQMMGIINEDNSKKDLSPMIRESLNSLIERNKHIVCDVEVTAPWNRETVEPDKSFKHYKVLVTFIGGYGTKYFPATQAVQEKYDNLMDEIWETVYGFFGEPIDVYSKKVRNCDKTITESSIISEEKLPATPKELIKSLPDKLKKLLFKQWNAKQNPTWHPEGNSLKHIIVVIQRAYRHYPDDPNMIMAALFHDLGKMDTYAIKPTTGQPTAYGHENKSTDYVEQFKDWISTFEGTDVDEIKYLVQNHMKIKPRTWDSMKDIKKEKISSNPSFDKLKGFTSKLDGGGYDLDKEEETEGVGAYAAPAFEMKPDHVHFKHQYNEGELTEKCWAGYTQKGMKTMFGKRYPNCVKKKK